ncbi:29323_t:CDS:1, partial [Racocetra persica]
CGIAVIEITKRIMEKYKGSLEGINLGVFDFPQARISWQKKYLTSQNSSNKQNSASETVIFTLEKCQD